MSNWSSCRYSLYGYSLERKG